MKPMIGLRSLLALPVLIGPLAVQAVVPTPTILDGNSVIPLGLVGLLTVAVFKAGRELQKLVQKLDKLERLERRMKRLAAHVNLPRDEDDGEDDEE